MPKYEPLKLPKVDPLELFNKNKCPKCGGFSAGGKTCISCSTLSIAPYRLKVELDKDLNRVPLPLERVGLLHTCIRCSNHSPHGQLCKKCFVEIAREYLELGMDVSGIEEFIGPVPQILVQRIPSPLIVFENDTFPIELGLVNNGESGMEIFLSIASDSSIMEVPSSEEQHKIAGLQQVRVSTPLHARRSGSCNLSITCRDAKVKGARPICSQEIRLIVSRSAEEVFDEVLTSIDSFFEKGWNLRRPEVKLHMASPRDLSSLGRKNACLPPSEKIPHINTPFCTPTDAFIPVIDRESSVDLLGEIMRSYVHEVFGHGFLFESPYGSLMRKCWTEVTQGTASIEKYALMKDSCVAAMEGFSVWLFTESAHALQSIFPAFHSALHRQNQLLALQLSSHDDPTHRIKNSPVFSGQPWLFDFDLSVIPECVNPYYYGFIWIQRLATLFGRECVPSLLIEAMSPDLSTAIGSTIPEEHRPDKRLFNIAFSDHRFSQKDLTLCHNDPELSIQMLKNKELN